MPKMRAVRPGRGGGGAAAPRGGRGAGARGSAAFRTSVVFNKAFGQHILKNPLIVDAIIDKVGDAITSPTPSLPWVA